MIRKWDILNEQAKNRCLDEIIARLDEQGDMQFGRLAAQDLLDIISDYLGPEVHNRAIEEAKKAFEKKLADLEVDLDVLRVVS